MTAETAVETPKAKKTKAAKTPAGPKAKKTKTKKAAEPTTKRCPVCATESAIDAAKCGECGYEYGLSSGPKVVEELYLPPDEVKPGVNSRMVAEANYLDTVQARAVSIAIDGQLSPAEGRRLDDGSVVIDFGNTRRDAVDMLRKGFEAVHPLTGERQLFHDPERKLWIRVMDTTADQAFLRAIKENIERKDTTDLQEALAQDELRNKGWSDTRIARFYGYDNQNRVMALKKLLTLDRDTQTKVHEGKMALHAALLTAEPGITADEREKIIAGATEGDRVRGEVVKKLVRELLEAKAGPGAEAITGDTPTPGSGSVTAATASDDSDKPPKIKRSVKEFKSFVNERVEDPGDLDESVLDLLKAVVKWFDGKTGFGDKAILNRLQNLKAK
jgi:ParB-like chromosome segregation protein Spo0J